MTGANGEGMVQGGVFLEVAEDRSAAHGRPDHVLETDLDDQIASNRRSVSRVEKVMFHPFIAARRHVGRDSRLESVCNRNGARAKKGSGMGSGMGRNFRISF